MKEKFSKEKFNIKDFDEKEYQILLKKAKDSGLEKLTSKECKLLSDFGNYYLEKEKNPYQAFISFEVVDDFEGLRKVGDYLIREQPDSFDLFNVFFKLEEHEKIRDLLNRKDIRFNNDVYDKAFKPLEEAIFEYIDSFLKENELSFATGKINVGVDLIAIKNLSKEYEVAVPIARGGLKQGAIAQLWGMPVKILAIKAHQRKRKKGKWLSPVSLNDFQGKKVLLFDKDAVSGASIRKAVEMLNDFSPKKIGVYFAHEILEAKTMGVGVKIEDLPEGVEVFSPNKNISLENAGDVYIEAHKKLKTLYGRFCQLEREIMKGIEENEEKFPELNKLFKKFVKEQFYLFNALNPNLEGVAVIRERMLNRLSVLFKDYQYLLKGETVESVQVVENFKNVLKTTSLLPLGFEAEIIKARYQKQAEVLAFQRKIKNFHYPADPVGAFAAAKKAVEDGFEAALIVGPEGFAYEPYFKDLGIETIAISVDWDSKKKSQSIKILDDLTKLKEKKVLIVDDDVTSGATLEEVIKILTSTKLVSLGLYLGQLEKFQKISNIPLKFEKIYLVKESERNAEVFKEFLHSRNLKIFKNRDLDKRIR